MFRTLPYIALLLTAIVSQLFIFDSLSTSVLVAPLVYVIFVVLLPVELSQIKMLGLGVMLGVIMDATMGTQGLNSIATIAIAFLRNPLLRTMVGKERITERGVPSEAMLGRGDFLQYVAIIVALHHFIFFLFEALSLSHLLFLALRFVVSSAISILFVWLISRLFLNSNILK